MSSKQQQTSLEMQQQQQQPPTFVNVPGPNMTITEAPTQGVTITSHAPVGTPQQHSFLAQQQQQQQQQVQQQQQQQVQQQKSSLDEVQRLNAQAQQIQARAGSSDSSEVRSVLEGIERRLSAIQADNVSRRLAEMESRIQQQQSAAGVAAPAWKPTLPVNDAMSPINIPASRVIVPQEAQKDNIGSDSRKEIDAVIEATKKNLSDIQQRMESVNKPAPVVEAAAPSAQQHRQTIEKFSADMEEMKRKLQAMTAPQQQQAAAPVAAAVSAPVVQQQQQQQQQAAPAVVDDTTDNDKDFGIPAGVTGNERDSTGLQTKEAIAAKFGEYQKAVHRNNKNHIEFSKRKDQMTEAQRGAAEQKLKDENRRVSEMTEAMINWFASEFTKAQQISESGVPESFNNVMGVLKTRGNVLKNEDISNMRTQLEVATMSAGGHVKQMTQLQESIELARQLEAAKQYKERSAATAREVENMDPQQRMRGIQQKIAGTGSAATQQQQQQQATAIPGHLKPAEQAFVSSVTQHIGFGQSALNDPKTLLSDQAFRLSNYVSTVSSNKKRTSSAASEPSDVVFNPAQSVDGAAWKQRYHTAESIPSFGTTFRPPRAVGGLNYPRNARQAELFQQLLRERDSTSVEKTIWYEHDSIPGLADAVSRSAPYRQQLQQQQPGSLLR